MERLGIGCLKRQRRHDVERIKAAFRLVGQREVDRLSHITVIHAAKEQPKAILVDAALRHKHPEAQRHGCNAPLTRINSCHFLAELFGHPVHIPGQEGVALIHNTPRIVRCPRAVAVNTHRGAEDNALDASLAGRLVDVERPRDIDGPEVLRAPFGQVDTVERRRMNDGIHTGNGCTDIIDIADIPDKRFRPTLTKSAEIEETQRVSGCGECGDDGAAEVASGAGDEDLHDGFIPVSKACFLRRVAFHADVCFKQGMYITIPRVMLGCLLAMSLWMPLRPVLAAQETKKVGHTTIRNIAYRENPESDKGIETRCRVDVHHPKSKGFATVVWFHGGGLTGGNRGIPDGLKDKGIAVVAAGYRLNPDVKSPTYIEDAAAAVAWTIKNIGKYGGDPNKIFVSGHSAGGYLSAMIGLDKRWLAPHGIDPDTLAGLIPLSPQAITHYTIRKERGIADTKVVVDDLAPINHVRPDAPSILLVTGDRELELLGRYEENAYFWRMFKVVGHKDVQLKELQGFNHGNMGDAALPLVVEFIRKRVGGK